MIPLGLIVAIPYAEEKSDSNIELYSYYTNQNNENNIKEQINVYGGIDQLYIKIRSSDQLEYVDLNNGGSREQNIIMEQQRVILEWFRKLLVIIAGIMWQIQNENAPKVPAKLQKRFGDLLPTELNLDRMRNELKDRIEGQIDKMLRELENGLKSAYRRKSEEVFDELKVLRKQIKSKKKRKKGTVVKELKLRPAGEYKKKESLLSKISKGVKLRSKRSSAGDGFFSDIETAIANTQLKSAMYPSTVQSRRRVAEQPPVPPQAPSFSAQAPPARRVSAPMPPPAGAAKPLDRFRKVDDQLEDSRSSSDQDDDEDIWDEDEFADDLHDVVIEEPMNIAEMKEAEKVEDSRVLPLDEVEEEQERMEIDELDTEYAGLEIEKVIDRSEALEGLDLKSDMLVEESQQFKKQARKLKPKVPQKKKKKEKKKKKTKVDDIFTDMQNVFNGLSNMLNIYYRSCFTLVFGTLFVYLIVSIFSLIIVLPTIFLLLAIRTKVVERKVEKFAERQQVLAHETVKQKRVRFVNLLFRSLPMLFALVGFPIISIYVIIPAYDASPMSVFLTVGLQVIFIIVLEILGTIRSTHSFNERKKQVISKNKELQRQMRHSTIRKPVQFENIDEDKLLEPSLLQRHKTPNHPNQMFEFRWKNFQNWIAILTLIIETFQLATFSFQTLEDSSESNDIDESWIDMNMLPALFINIVKFASEYNVNYLVVYSLISVCVTGILILVFLVIFLKDLKRFGLLNAHGQSNEANEYFFYSFVGSVVFAHGEIRGISAKVVAIVTVLADTLLMVVLTKMLLVLTCDYKNSIPVLLMDSSVECWTGDHQFYAVLTLISFSFYIPLSVMIAPMLTEAADSASNNERKKDIAYVKPFLSLVAVVKCLMLVGSTFFGKDDPETTVLVSAFMMFVLFIVTVYWSFKDANTSYLLHTQSIDPTKASRIQGSLGEPCLPPVLNIWRSLSFAIGIMGSIIALMAHRHPKLLSGDRKYILLSICIFLFTIIGMFWYRGWKRSTMFIIEALSRQQSINSYSEDIEMSEPVIPNDIKSSSTSSFIEQNELLRYDGETNQWCVVIRNIISQPSIKAN